MSTFSSSYVRHNFPLSESERRRMGVFFKMIFFKRIISLSMLSFNQSPSTLVSGFLILREQLQKYIRVTGVYCQVQVFLLINVPIFILYIYCDYFLPLFISIVDRKKKVKTLIIQLLSEHKRVFKCLFGFPTVIIKSGC